MTSTGFFLPGGAPSRAYRNIRDNIDGPAPKARAFIEDLWLRYRGYEDPHFLRDAQTHFLERFWEMYLAVTFMEHDLRPSREGSVGEDRVEEPEIGVATYVPTEKILLRFTNALNEKRKRYLAAHTKGIVREQDCYVVAINSRGIPHAPYGNTLPFFVQALLPIGDPTMVIDQATGELIDSYYALRETITKTKGSPVSTATFFDPEYSFISAVLHSGVDCVNRPEALGQDFVVLHNPTARRPLEMSVLSWCRQYVYSDGELKVHAG
jgi:hypothetical protein